jgi:hypothetical protein
LAAVWLGPGLLARRSFLFPSNPVPVVEGIEAPPEQDGRLLGHFPYDEAIVSQLVLLKLVLSCIRMQHLPWIRCAVLLPPMELI